jgi:hypothetical protein
MVFHRIVLAAFALLLGAAAANAQSVHTQPVGSVFEGKVKFARSEVPLPPGKWTLASAGEERSRGEASERLPFANLVQADRGRLSALVAIYGTLADERIVWSRDRNCDSTDMLYATADKNFQPTDQWCAYARHVVRTWVSNDQTAPRLATLFAYMRQENIKAPWTMLTATARITRQGEFIAVTYEIDPTTRGGPETKIQAVQTSEWHPQRIQNYPTHRAYAEKWIDWSKPLLDSVKEGFGRTLRISSLQPFPQIGAAPAGVGLASVGTHFIREDGAGFRIQGIDSTVVTTVNARGLVMNWQVGGLVPFLNNQPFERENAGKLLPLKVGNKAVFERSAAVGSNRWRHTMEVVRTETIAVAGRDYAAFVVEDRIEGLQESQRGFSMKRTVWFSPDVGWLLKFHEEQLAGPPSEMFSWRVSRIQSPN